MSKKIAVVTDFLNFPSQYALVPVVLAQVRMLLKQGWETHLFVVEGTEFDDSTVVVPEGTVIRPNLPFMHLYDYSTGKQEQKHDVSPIGEHGTPNKTNLRKQIDLAYQYLEPELKEFDIVIEHDILYQSWKIPYNSALRRIANKHDHIKWLHWCHSAPEVRPDNLTFPTNLRFSPMKNSVWVTFNEPMQRGFAVQYGVSKDKVKVVYHYIDQNFHEFSEPTMQLIEKHDLFNADVLCVYPVRFDHIAGKGVPKPLKLIAYMNRFCNAKMVYLNSWSGKKATAIKNLRNTATKIGMPLENLIFSSELGKQYENGVPRRVVREMLDIANLFCMPSQSETFSLTLGEAMQKKLFIVYNSDLASVKEIHGEIGYPFPWESNWGGNRIDQDYQPSEEAFYLERAKEIWEEIEKNPVLMSQRRGLKLFTQDWIYKNQLKPILEN